jgi:3-oxoacyl-[acyl-carrier-protein] synthase-3
MPNAIILGTGSCVPDKILTNHHFEKVGSNDAWIQERLGIKERRVVDGQTTSDLASGAALNALKSAGLDAKDIDLIVLATATPDRPAPATACAVQDKIGASNAVAFDISAVCSGALFALSTGCQYIQSGMYRNVMVIGADTFSNITDWERRDSVFFGDGAGAIVLTSTDEERGFIKFELHSDGAGKDGFTVPAGGCETPTTEETMKQGLHCFQMDGKAVFETAVSKVPGTIQSTTSAACCPTNRASASSKKSPAASACHGTKSEPTWTAMPILLVAPFPSSWMRLGGPKNFMPATTCSLPPLEQAGHGVPHSISAEHA